MTQFKVNTQMSKVYDLNKDSFTALVAKGCLCLSKNDSRSPIILNTSQVVNRGTYLEISSQEIERENVCLSFRNQGDLGSCFGELSKWSDRTVLSAWEISENMIGNGAEGSVYHGTSRQGTNQGMAVAVKITKGVSKNEAFTNVCLEDHENVLVALDVLRDDTSTYIVMPFLQEAETLNDFLLRSRRNLRLDTVKLYTRQILSAVAYLHAAGISHGDLHPGNVMVQDNLQKVTIIDFGFASIDPSEQKPDIRSCAIILKFMIRTGGMGTQAQELIGLLHRAEVTAAEALIDGWF